jgi:hypothetical protein
LVVEEGGFMDICGRGETGLEEEFEGLQRRVGKAVEEFDGRMGVLRGE